MGHYICLDIGGTSVKHGMVSADGTFLETQQTPTEAHKGGRHIAKKTVLCIEGYLEKYSVEGVCISTAGMVNSDSGAIFYASPLIPGYTGINLKETVERRFGIPCEVENDVNCAGLAEAVSGAGKGASSVLCVTVGTGIGGSFILDGEIYRGCCGSACEVGYMLDGGLAFQDTGSARSMCTWVERRKKESGWDGEKIFDAAQDGDRVCGAAVERMCGSLARGIANLCYVLNPEIVVFGGGVTARQDVLGPEIDRYLDQYLLPVIRERTKVRFARYGNSAGMMGAFYNYRKKHFE